MDSWAFLASWIDIYTSHLGQMCTLTLLDLQQFIGMLWLNINHTTDRYKSYGKCMGNLKSLHWIPVREHTKCKISLRLHVISGPASRLRQASCCFVNLIIHGLLLYTSYKILYPWNSIQDFYSFKQTESTPVLLETKFLLWCYSFFQI